MLKNIILIIKQIIKILCDKRFYKYIKDGIINIPNIFANKINNYTKKITKSKGD